MKENYTHISVVLDRSGSMMSMRNEVINGFNEFIAGQKAVEGEATLTMAQFDDHYELLHNMANLKDVNELTVTTFQPRGSTALLDAMGKIITDVRSKIHEMDEADKPSKVIFVFITDGQENASSKFKRKDIFGMIQDQRDEENWEFVFIGANQDAIAEGSSLGIRYNMNWETSSDGTQVVFSSLTRGMTDYRLCSNKNAQYSFNNDNDNIIETK